MKARNQLKNTKVLMIYIQSFNLFSLFFRFDLFFRYSISLACNGYKNFGHNRHQQLKINTQRYFVFRFPQIFILMVLFAVFVSHIELKKFNGKLVCNPIQCHTLKNMICQIDEQCLKNEDVRVPHKKSRK